MNGWVTRSCLVALLVLAAVPVTARQVLVRNYANPALEVGQGYLTHYDGVCYVLLPTHVLAESGMPAALLGEGSASELGETTARQDLGDDVSLARVGGGLTAACGYGALSISRAVDRTLRDNGIATVRSVNGDGTIGQFSVSLFDDDGVAFLRVQPTNPDNQLRKGQSGSLLVAGDRPVAMLLSVDARFGVGKAIRLDAMLAKFDRFIREGARMADSVASAPVRSAAEPPRPSMAGPVGVPLEPLEWSALPMDAAHRPANLIARDAGVPGWRARVDAWPVVLDFSLGNDRVAIREVRLETGAEPSATLPTRLEVFVSSTTGEDRWRSVASGRPDYAGGAASFAFAPTWARKVRLVIGAGGNPAELALHRFRVMAAE